MALADRTQDLVVPYSIDNTFEALKKALPPLSEYKLKVDGFDENTKTAYITAGISWLSWGEDITVSLDQAQTGGTAVSILSSPKTGVLFGGAMDFGKNRENIELIIDALSAELDNYKK